MEHHSAVLLRRLNPYCAQALEAAASLCQTRAHAEITPEHWLLKLLEQGEGDIIVIARRYEWDIDNLWQSLLAHLDVQPRSVKSRPQLSDAFLSLMQQAWLCAATDENSQIRSVHLLMALVGKPSLLKCDGLWPLLSAGHTQLERLLPLSDEYRRFCHPPSSWASADVARFGYWHAVHRCYQCRNFFCSQPYACFSV